MGAARTIRPKCFNKFCSNLPKAKISQEAVSVGGLSHFECYLFGT